MLRVLLVLAVWSSASSVGAAEWDPDRVQGVLDKTLELRLDPSLDHLGPGERVAVEKLLEVGTIFQELFELQRHHQALSARDALRTRHAASPTSATGDLLKLYRLYRGPIATTLENTREPFLPVDGIVPGKNVYPRGVTKEEFDAYLERHPHQRAELLHLRSIVRALTGENLARDLAVLDRYPALDTLHPGLRERWEGWSEEAGDVAYYGVPYSVAWPDRLMRAYGLLHEAADAVAPEDIQFARYLRARAHDLLIDTYDGGDATWITGRFRHLNAQIGSYETYDDELYGVKSFFSLSLLARDREASAELAAAIGDLQSVEDALPYDAQKQVRSDIPVGVYRVIADFGQARSTNTATILPNEAHLSRRYGRTILLRENIMRHPRLFDGTHAEYAAVVMPEHAADLTADGNFYRTLWHEIGHYLGVDVTEDGQTLDEALAQYSDLLEEMKADLVSLASVEHNLRTGVYDDSRARAIYAGGVRRVLQKRPPRRSQAYGTMQLMQWNWYLEHGLLEFVADEGRLRIHYDRYPEVVGGLLREVLAVQRAGSLERAAAFVERWGGWDEDLHGVIAQRIRDAERFRFRLVRYGALDGSSD